MSTAPGLVEVLGLDRGRLAGLVAALKDRSLTVASAESLTAGLVTAALTEVPGSSAVVRGGLVVYGTDLKHSLAEVNADLLAAGGPVQREVAVQLAQGARRRCGASIGLGLTGVAGPDPQDGVAVGTWHVAIAHAGGTAWTERIPTAGQQVPDRSEIRAQAARAALGLLAWQVDAVPPVGVRV